MATIATFVAKLTFAAILGNPYQTRVSLILRGLHIHFVKRDLFLKELSIFARAG
jgi:hypothetical protein